MRKEVEEFLASRPVAKTVRFPFDLTLEEIEAIEMLLVKTYGGFGSEYHPGQYHCFTAHE